MTQSQSLEKAEGAHPRMHAQSARPHRAGIQYMRGMAAPFLHRKPPRQYPSRTPSGFGLGLCLTLATSSRIIYHEGQFTVTLIRRSGGQEGRRSDEEPPHAVPTARRKVQVAMRDE